MKRFLLLGLAFVVASRASAEDLSSSALQKVKSSTAYVNGRLRRGSAEASGSGFLVKREGKTGYVITCAHVVVEMESISVVMKGKTTGARVVAMDVGADLACLKLDDRADLPEPLTVAAKTDVHETSVVFVAGFPFGKLLATAGTNPEIAITRSSVASLRNSPDGALLVIQLAGDVNPGNSGGPVVDGKGRVVGIAASKVVGTQTAFAIPPEEVNDFLLGRGTSVSVRAAEGSTGGVDLFIDAGVADAFGGIRTIDARWIRKSALATAPKPGEGGIWGEASADMAGVAMKLTADRQAASGQFNFKKEAGDPDPLKLTLQIRWQRSTEERWSRPFEIEVTLSPKPVARVLDQDHPETAPGPGPGPGPKPPDRPSIDLVPMAVPDSFGEPRKIKVGGSIQDFFASPAGDWLFALDVFSCRVLKIHAETFEVAAEYDAGAQATALAASPSGDRLYVVSRVSPRTPSEPPRWRGKLVVLDPSELKALKEVVFDGDPWDLVASPEGMLVVAQQSPAPGVLFVNPETGAVSEVAGIGQPGVDNLRLHPDGARIYATNGQGGSQWLCFSSAAPAHAGFATVRSSTYNVLAFEITPDGRFSLASNGACLRLQNTAPAGRDFAAWSQEGGSVAGTIDAWTSVAFAPGIDTFFSAHSNGIVRARSLKDFSLVKAVSVHRTCYRLLLDAKRKILFAAAAELPKEGTSPAPPSLQAQDLYAWPVER